MLEIQYVMLNSFQHLTASPNKRIPPSHSDIKRPDFATNNRNFFYTQASAWRGNNYGMAWKENFPRHAKKTDGKAAEIGRQINYYR